MFHLRKCGFDGFTKRGCAAGKPDIKHRAYRNSTAVLFSVVKTKSAVAVFFRIFVWAAVFAAASLHTAGRSYHYRFHTVEGRGIGKIHFDRSFCEMKKARSLFQNFGRRAIKNGRQVFDDLSADICVYLDLQEFISFLKGKIAVLYLCFWTPQFSRIDSKNPDKIGVFAEHIFFMFLLWRRRRDSNPRAGFPAYALSRGASSTSLSTSPNCDQSDLRAILF